MAIPAVPFRNVDAVAPALGVNSSVDDLLAFLALHLDEGRLDGSELLSADTLRELHEPQIEMEPATGEARHYALGLVTGRHEGHRLLSHEGGVDGFRALISLLPDDDIGVVVLANSSARHELVQRLGRELWHRLLGRVGRADSRPPGVDGSPGAGSRPLEPGDHGGDRPAFADGIRLDDDLPLGGYTGNFEHPAYGTVGVWMRHGGLELSFHGLDLPLDLADAGRFEVAEGHPFAGLPVWFGADRTGAVNRLAVPFEPAVEPIVFDRVPSGWTREPSFLRDFVGAYRLDGTVLRVELDVDVLRLVIPGAEPFELVPLDHTTFDVHDLDGTSLEFRRDGAGDVVGMAVRQTHATLVAQRR